MPSEKQNIEDAEIENMNLRQITQLAVDEAISYGHYIEHEKRGAGKFTVRYNSTGTTSILHQKLAEIGFHEDSERTEIDFEEGTKTVFFEYSPEQED